jgi:outer membrane protein
MRKLLVCAAIGASALVPAAASAQSIPAAVVAVVDLDRVTSQCNACKTAANALRSQVTAYNNREKALITPLQAEAKAIQTAVDALGSKQPDAALQNRANAFRTRQQTAQQELSRQQQQLQRNQQHIQRQISQKLGPIYQQVMQRRGANMMMEVGSTLATTTSVDVTNDVLTALNSALPSIQAVAPAETRPQQPQGR